jgi:hypothetical protein
MHDASVAASALGPCGGVPRARPTGGPQVLADHLGGVGHLRMTFPCTPAFPQAAASEAIKGRASR